MQAIYIVVCVYLYVYIFQQYILKRLEIHYHICHVYIYVVYTVCGYVRF